MVAMYRLTVAGFLPLLTSCSMNPRMVVGSAGRNDSPRPSQNAWKIAPSGVRGLSEEKHPIDGPCESQTYTRMVIA
jgi:hypothetical protein